MRRRAFIASAVALLLPWRRAAVQLSPFLQRSPFLLTTGERIIPLSQLSVVNINLDAWAIHTRDFERSVKRALRGVRL